MPSGSGRSPSPSRIQEDGPPENRRAKRHTQSSTSDTPYLMKHRAPLVSSDISSLNILQDLVSPRALLSSRFVFAPLMKARIKLPPSDQKEEKVVDTENDWQGSGSGSGISSRDLRTDSINQPVLFNSLGVPLERDPRMR